MRVHVALLLVMIALITGCGKKKTTVRTPRAPHIGDTEKGIASWYGNPYHGRRAANGEIYDMEKLTAAHRTLPFGTWVEVDNLDTKKRVTVRITDRGPFVDNRIIDISRAAARSIEMLGPGLANVKLTIVSPPAASELPVVNLYAVQIGAFQDRERASGLRRRLEQEYGVARLIVRQANVPLYRVLVGEEQTMEGAEALASRLQGEFRTAFAVRIDTPSGE